MTREPYITTPIRKSGRGTFIIYGILSLFFICRPQSVNGSDNYPAGARSMALSHASVSLSDTWSTFHNQAGVALIKEISAGFFFESKYGIDDLSLAAASVIMPAGKGAFGISFLQFGKGSFRESKYAVTYAHQLSDKWSAGLQLDYFSHLFPENEQAKSFATFEGGILFRLNRDVQLGAHVFNPVQGGFESPTGRQEMPLTVKAGGGYSIEDRVLIVFEAQKDNLNPVQLKSGIEFYPADCFAVRIGTSGKPLRYTAGFGYRTERLSADFGFGYHGNLGITPSLSLQFGL